MNRLIRIAALMIAAANAANAQAPSQEKERQRDLNSIRSRIATLRGKLAESQKNVSTLSEEIRRLGLRIELGEQETQLLAAKRDELTRQLQATETERASAAAASDRFAGALATRARVLHR